MFNTPRQYANIPLIEKRRLFKKPMNNEHLIGDGEVISCNNYYTWLNLISIENGIELK